jgi:hypothetical protein
VLGHAVQRRAENELRAAFRARGAVSPPTALPGKDLVVDKNAFDELLGRSVTRVVSPDKSRQSCWMAARWFIYNRARQT